jgi:hypothetical protein
MMALTCSADAGCGPEYVGGVTWFMYYSSLFRPL